MGEVYRARDTELEREVAVKVLPEAVSGDPDRLERFKREARAVAALSHPNILEIFDVGSANNTRFVVTELLEGQTLRQRIPPSGLAWQKVVEMGACIADGLAAAHGKGIVHRDLKPENVFVTSDGRVKVLDFGLARMRTAVDGEAGTATLTPAGTQTGTILGTVGYMSPEQVRGKPSDARSDIFALGCVLYEMVSGARAFGGDTTMETMAAILKEEPPQLSSSGATVPAELERAVHRCLEKSPEARFQSTADLAYSLKSIGTGPAVVMATPTGEVRPVTGRSRWWLAAAGVLALVVVGIAGWRLLQPPRAITEQSRPSPEPAPITIIEEWLVAVEPFENRTGDPSLDSVGSILVDRLVDGLGRVTQGLQSLPSVTIVMAGGNDTDPIAAGAASSAARGWILVTGSYVARDAHLEVVAQVRDPAGRRVLYTSEPVEVSRQLRGGEPETLLQGVMGAVGIHIYMGLDNVSHVPHYDAFHEFLAGLEESWSRDVRAGAVRIEEALRLDPEFLRPAFLFVAYGLSTGRFENVPPNLEHIRRRSHRLTEFESLELEMYEGWYDGSIGQALRAARRLQELAPADPFVRVIRARMATDLNRPGEAVETLADIVQHIPRGFARLRRQATIGLRRSYDKLGDYDRLLELARQMRHEAPGDTEAFLTEAIALAGLNRLDELDSLVEECRSLPGGECDAGRVMVQAGWYLAGRGHREKCVEYGNRAASLLESLPEDELIRREGRYLNALRAAERWDEYAALARKLNERAEEGTDWRSYTLSCVGMAAAHGGDRETAESAIRELEVRDYLYYAAFVAGHLGDLDRAIDYLRRSLEQQKGITYASLYRWDLDLEPLWGYDPFEELVRPKG
jgi:serine/threonine protein kinase/tetratricopeptide (TPR) repeat protein